MKPANGLTELRGVLVVTVAEGAVLGSISKIFVNPRTRKISAVTLRSTGSKKEVFVERENITLVGKDVVLVARESSAKAITADAKPKGTSLKELQGTWVTTLEGKHLGALVDIEIDRKEWTLCELRLADGKTLPIKVQDVTLGPDQILVPASYAERVVRRPRGEKTEGFLGRIFGAEAIEDVGKTIRRALKRPKSTESTAPAIKVAEKKTVAKGSKDDTEAAVKPTAKKKEKAVVVTQIAPAESAS